MRGEYYLWSDSENCLHIWVADGYDGWDEAIWAMDEEGEKRRKDRLSASGTSIPEKVMDEFVVMRLAEMIDEGIVEQAIERAIAKWSGNFGCSALQKHAAKLKATFAQFTPVDTA
jgi:hypothetical protein